MNIVKIQQRNKIWKEVNSDDYIIKELELKKGRSQLHLIYNGDITFKVIYECENCKKLIETNWKKFVISQINNNKCLCQKCTMGLIEIRDKISISTKSAMDNKKLKEHLSIKQRERWGNNNEIKKRKIISTEIMQRPGMKEYISKRTKEEMNKLELKELCNPYKHMNENEKSEYLSNVGKSISENYNKETYDKFINSYNNTMKNEKNQEKLINGIIQSQKNKHSNNHKIAINYIKKIYDNEIIEEYPINLYYLNDIYKFILIDIVIPEFNIAIEISGNYYHDALNEFINGMPIDKVIEKYRDNEFQMLRFKKDLFKMNYLKDNNWNLYYITEDDIINCDFIDKLNNILRKGE